MKINKIRSICYSVAKYLGDYNAVKKGKVARRVGRRVAGKGVGRLFQKFFK